MTQDSEVPEEEPGDGWWLVLAALFILAMTCGAMMFFATVCQGCY